MRDVVERAKAALEALGDKGPWTIDSEDGEPIIHEAHHYDSTDEWYDVDGVNGGWVAHCEDLPVAEFIAASRTLIPELVAEVERLRAGGAWVERVEYQRALKRERDGGCICNTGPDTDGPDEFCPWHGRPYPELVEILNRLSSECDPDTCRHRDHWELRA
ncbi:hypothetical protein SEA_CHOTABHAI_42 [Mycobacterium phage ChotaBhai]|nr:hypothetical protein SEA_CHOTABHAI_42 [Mycobacterium phage ChotaBhai]